MHRYEGHWTPYILREVTSLIYHRQPGYCSRGDVIEVGRMVGLKEMENLGRAQQTSLCYLGVLQPLNCVSPFWTLHHGTPTHARRGVRNNSCGPNPVSIWLMGRPCRSQQPLATLVTELSGWPLRWGTHPPRQSNPDVSNKERRTLILVPSPWYRCSLISYHFPDSIGFYGGQQPGNDRRLRTAQT